MTIIDSSEKACALAISLKIPEVYELSSLKENFPKFLAKSVQDQDFELLEGTIYGLENVWQADILVHFDKIYAAVEETSKNYHAGHKRLLEFLLDQLTE